MNQNDKVMDSKLMFENLLSSFVPESGSELPTVWKKVVSKIGRKKDEEPEEITLGERIAANTHAVDLKNGVLLIEANHSGWIQYLKMYQNFILKGLSWEVPTLNIKNLAFRVAGSNARLSDSYEDDVKKSQEKMNKKMQENQKELEKTFKTAENKATPETLPPEVLAMFDKLRQSADNAN